MKVSGHPFLITRRALFLIKLINTHTAILRAHPSWNDYFALAPQALAKLQFRETVDGKAISLGSVIFLFDCCPKFPSGDSVCTFRVRSTRFHDFFGIVESV